MLTFRRHIQLGIHFVFRNISTRNTKKRGIKHTHMHILRKFEGDISCVSIIIK